MCRTTCTSPLQRSVSKAQGRTKFKPTVLDLLGEPEVDELEVALGVDEDVFRLQVAVCDALALVQELENQDNLGGVELGRRLVEAARAAEVAEDLAAGAVIELAAVSNWERRSRTPSLTSMYSES